MRLPSLVTLTILSLFTGDLTASAQDGLITTPSAHSASSTLDRLEAALKERGFTIFTRIDHAAAAAAAGLKMPPSTVLVFGIPRVGTPAFVQKPTLAIDLPLKALVYEDSTGKVWVSYNSADYVLGPIYSRHGVTPNPEAKPRTEKALAEATEAATK
jgi:uncharacterized protein (DUF302 family)